MFSIGGDLEVSYIIMALVAFLVGAFPTSYLSGRLLQGIDLREYGSGNLGATNVYRVMGARPAMIVLAADIFKGFAPVFWLPSFTAQIDVTALKVVLGLAAVAGHVFSPFVGFRGGKGVATGAGVVFAICPLAVVLCMAVWLAFLAIFRIVSVASIAAAVSLPVFINLTMEHSGAGFATIQAFSIALAAVVFFTHRSNIKRLIKGEEKRLTRPRAGR